MITGDSTATEGLMNLLQLEQQVRCSESATALHFIMVNATRSLVHYDQAALLLGSELERLRVQALSDTPLLDHTYPFIPALEQTLHELDQLGSFKRQQVQSLSATQLSKKQQSALDEFSPKYQLWIPLMLPSRPGERLGVLWLARATPWTDREQGLLQHLSGSYTHALQLFTDTSLIRNLKERWISKKWLGVSLAALILLMFLPVRISVLAPGEVAPRSPALITAPLTGSIKKILVTPGQMVQAGQPLVEMDITELKGELDIAQNELLKAQAELKTAQQAGFSDIQAKGRIAELSTLVQLRYAERNFAQTRFERATLKASMSGLAILNDPRALEGRPVQVGEKIMQLANPEEIELKILLPVQDAVTLDAGAEMLFFLDTDPLNPIAAQLRYSVYEPEITPEQTLAYKVVGDFTHIPKDTLPRIGLRGTAKLYGEKVTLFYYLFRRPITALRQWLGW